MPCLDTPPRSPPLVSHLICIYDSWQVVVDIAIRRRRVVRAPIGDAGTDADADPPALEERRVVDDAAQLPACHQRCDALSFRPSPPGLVIAIILTNTFLDLLWINNNDHQIFNR